MVELGRKCANIINNELLTISFCNKSVWNHNKTPPRLELDLIVKLILISQQMIKLKTEWRKESEKKAYQCS